MIKIEASFTLMKVYYSEEEINNAFSTIKAIEQDVCMKLNIPKEKVKFYDTYDRLNGGYVTVKIFGEHIDSDNFTCKCGNKRLNKIKDKNCWQCGNPI